MKITKHTLTNGLKAVIIEKPNSAVVSISAYVGAGERYEGSENGGISHFLEHMAFKGTRKYPTNDKLAGLIESLGGKQNAWTSHDHTAYWMILPKNHFSIGLDVLSEQLCCQLLDEAEIEREKQVIIEEINMIFDDPNALAWHSLREAMWPGQAIGSDLAKERESIKKLKRPDFIDYLRKHYVADNMSICVAGGIKKDEVIDELEKSFKKLKKAEKIKPVEIDLDQKAPRTKVIYKDTDQANIILGYKSFSLFDKRRFVLDVLFAILGAGMGSVLFREVREKRGLAYAVFTVSPDYYSEFGTAPIYAGVSKENAEEAIILIKDILERAKREFFSEDEINRAKEFLKGGYLISLENAKNLSNWYAEREFLDPKKPEPAEILKLIDSVTATEIQEVANAIFRPERETLLVVGPFKNDEKFGKLLSRE